jgi:acetyl-CoA carboxylase carboxyl transferase subunit beta
VNWINNVVRPKIRGFLGAKREVPDDMWRTDPESGQMVYYKDLEANQFVFPGSNYHERMTAPQRLAHVFDEGAFARTAVPGVMADPLKFRDSIKYPDRLKEARTKTELEDSVLVGEGKLDGQDIIAAAHDMRFVGGSLGMAAGQAIITGMMRAVEKKTPFILFAASGGARMQEGIMSLMQMPRTTIAVQRLREQRLPYIVVLTDPTTGGVTASYAMLGDVHIAEPGALICFAGPRVIQQTIREQLPDGFQRAEYLLAHGMVDMVVHRHKLKATLSRLCRLMMANHDLVKLPGKRRPLNGHPVTGAHLNGVAIEAPAATARGDTTVEAEPVTGAMRFDTSRTGAAATPAKPPTKPAS